MTHIHVYVDLQRCTSAHVHCRHDCCCRQVRDAGNLLTRADLALPTVDVDTFMMHYSSPVALVSHLRLMGESNALQVG